MCGICGTLDSSQDFISQMTQALTHRGPDSINWISFNNHNVSLGHTRLKVVDLSDNGLQPMSNKEKTVWITYNGEIYNYLEIKKKLIEKGYSFKSETDTEVVLYSYLEYGDDFISQLNGDFAFAIWDSRNKSLNLYRDRIGIRPLYYTYQKGTFGFASEIKSLLKHPDFSPPQINLQKLPEFFSNYFISGEETMFKNIHELQPGCFLKYTEGKILKGRYFDFSYNPQIRQLDEEEQIEQFQEIFDDAVKIRLMSDVAIGTYLSGGIDSSYLTYRLSHLNLSDTHTFSLGFSRNNLNEFVYSDKVAKKFKTIHTKFILNQNDFDEAIDKIIWHFDEPPPHTVSVPHFYLSREAKPHLTVALSGAGGDELFAGYSHYEKALSCKKDWPDSFIASEFKSCNQKNLVDEIFKKPIEDYRPQISHYFENNNYPDFLSKMLYMDFKTHVVAMMNKDDKMNMAHGVEGRFPFLDYRVVSHCLSMSDSLKIRKNSGKIALKKLCEPLFGKEFTHRQKQAFPTPVDFWLKDFKSSDLIYIKECIPESDQLFNFDFIAKLVDNPESLCKTGSPQRRKWGVYCLENWIKIWFGS